MSLSARRKKPRGPGTVDPGIDRFTESVRPGRISIEEERA